MSLSCNVEGSVAKVVLYLQVGTRQLAHGIHGSPTARSLVHLYLVSILIRLGTTSWKYCINKDIMNIDHLDS